MQKSKNSKSKIPLTRIPSDDCVINIGQVVEDGAITNAGTPYSVHEGEWVEIIPVMSVREVMHLTRLQRGSDDTSGLGDNLTALCLELSKRVVRWSWTDLMGSTLEQPHNRPDILEGLSSDELLWLVSAASGQETEDQRKKDSPMSESIS